MTVKNTILASTASTPCEQTDPNSIVSATPGNNIDAGTTCGFGTTNGNRENVTPGMLALGPLLLNAPGTTMTHALGAGSVAINTATADCGGLGTDQRGVVRPQGPACDVGAFEVQVPAPAGAGTTTDNSAALAEALAKCKKKPTKKKRRKCRQKARERFPV